MHNIVPWTILIVYFLILLSIDFLVLHKKEKKSSNKRIIWETIFFVINAMLFSVYIYYAYENNWVDNLNKLSGTQSVVKYLTGYIIELSLSVDNLFVIAIIFESFKIPSQYQHKLLFLGIIGAIVFRAILIIIGLVLIHKIHSITIVFGLFLLFTAFKMLKKEDKPDLEDSSFLTRFFGISNKLDNGYFRTEVNGKKVFTALFGALITIEFTDLLFALDSIPAVFAITTDPYLVLSSNIFALLGLRSLFFLLANMLEKFVYLKYSVFSILLFVGIKLICTQWVEIPEAFSLLFIGLALGMGIWLSIIKSNQETVA